MKRCLMAVLGAAVVWQGAAVASEVGGEGARELGGRVAGDLMARLMVALQGKIAEEGAAGAVRFCREEALDLTAESAAAFEGVVDVRRIGVRTRNPRNVPDAVDREVLEEFLRNWEPPGEARLRRVEGEDGGGVWRFYQPVTVGANCLACHGERGAMAPEVVAALDEAYPEDAATGFQPGDLRGAVVVEIDAGGR
jgi:hypothetical protein